MSFTDAKRRANEKYLREKLEGITFRVKKGMKEQIRNHAQARGESMNAFILRAVYETIERDQKMQIDNFMQER